MPAHWPPSEENDAVLHAYAATHGMAKLQEAISSIQDTYGREHLQLTVVKAYVAKLLGNARVVRYLTQHRPSFLQEFEAIAEATSTLTHAEA